MSPMNWKRVVLAGLLAGLVMNIGEAALHGGLLGQDGTELFEKMNVSTTPHPLQMVGLICVTFVLGVAAVWLYASIRPRYGPGPATAVRAGLAVWVIAHVWSGTYLGAGFTGLIPAKMAWLPVAWGLVEAPLATVIGAKFYKE